MFYSTKKLLNLRIGLLLYALITISSTDPVFKNLNVRENSYVKTGNDLVLNNFKDELRKKGPDNFTDLNVDETQIGSPNNNESEVILTELEKCLENFSERDKEIFRLIGLEYSYEEISKDMNISESNLRQIMYRRRPELAECLERAAV